MKTERTCYMYMCMYMHMHVHVPRYFTATSENFKLLRANQAIATCNNRIQYRRCINHRNPHGHVQPYVEAVGCASRVRLLASRLSLAQRATLRSRLHSSVLFLFRPQRICFACSASLLAEGHLGLPSARAQHCVTLCHPLSGVRRRGRPRQAPVRQGKPQPPQQPP
jgi:hypothetical protein